MLKTISRKFGRLRQIIAGQGYKAAAVLVLSWLYGKARSLARRLPHFSFAKSGNTAALRQSLAECQDSIRQLTALLAATAAPAAADGAKLPKISVIMPVYNRADIIQGAIRSVLAQAGVNFELIVVDDGSTDALAAAVPELDDPRVSLLRRPHLGVSAARNAGVAASTGEVIAYLDSDNLMYPGYLRALAAAYAANLDAGCGHAAMLWDDGKQSLHLRHDAFSWGRLLQRKVNIDLNCFSHRRSVWEVHGGFDESLTRHGDFDLTLRYLRTQPPLRIAAVAAKYYAGDDFARITLDEFSEMNMARIRAKHTSLAGRKPRVLVVCYDYPQRSESYIATEIAYMLHQGFEIEVFSRAAPGSPGTAQVRVHRGEVQNAIDDFQPDLLHAHWLSIGAETAPLARRNGLPLTVRGHGFEFTAGALARCVNAPAVQAVYLFPSFAAAMGKGEAKVRAVPAAFNAKRFYPHRPKNRKMVLRAASCLDTKDIELFFAAAARCPAFQFVLALASIAHRPDLSEGFRALNASLGHPVDLRFDVTYEDMAELVDEAGIYLHTFGFHEPFGMPVSIAEALACGALVILRDAPAARQFAGPMSCYYNVVEEAVAFIQATAAWSEMQWQDHAAAATAFARQYADEVALAPIRDDWRALLLGKDGSTSPGSSPRACFF